MMHASFSTRTDDPAACVFCAELQPLGEPAQTGPEDLPVYARILAKNDGLFLMPTLGCFVKGYLLLSTVNHYVSLVACPDGIVGQVEHALERLRGHFRERMGSGMLFFEHGTVSDQTLSSASIFHFHIHLLPVNENLWERVGAQCRFRMLEIDSLARVRDIVRERGISAYFLLGDWDGRMYLADCSDTGFHSQFLREVLYGYYFGGSGSEAWNWRKAPFYEQMRQTKKLFSGVTL